MLSTRKPGGAHKSTAHCFVNMNETKPESEIQWLQLQEVDFSIILDSEGRSALVKGFMDL